MFLNLALFFVSFILTALLAPRPQFENARKEELDPEQFPRATEDAPVPLVLGKVKVNGPNTIWYGDFRAEPVVENIRTSLFSSTNVIVAYNYYLTIDLAICLGPCQLHEIVIDGEPVQPGGEEEEFTAEHLGGVSTARTFTTRRFVTVDLSEVFSIAPEDLDIFDFTAGHGGGIVMNFINLAGGGPAPGSLRIDIFYRRADMSLISSLIDADTGINLSAGVGGVVPKQTRFIEFGILFNPTFPLFTIIDGPSTTNYVITARGPIEFESDIYEPELFGGRKKGGGWIGNFRFYPGSLSQSVNQYIQNFLGEPIPAYNGVCHIVFENNFIGESPTLRGISFVVSSYSNNLQLNEKARIGVDINPAEALAEIILNKWRGLGRVSSSIDYDNFREVGEILFDEGNGVSIIVSSGRTGRDVISEVLRQINGSMYQDNESMEFKLRLIRRDYDTELLPRFDENDIISISSFSKTAWADVYAQVKVSFSSREKDTNLTAVAQDMAVANMKNGELKTMNVSFPMCYDPNTAAMLASRELAQFSVPVFKMTIELNRTAHLMKPTYPFIIDFPEYGIFNVVMRVQEIDFGELINNRIIIQAVQDIFALDDVVISPPSPSSWTGIERIPAAVTMFEVMEIPHYFIGRIGMEIDETRAFPLVIPRRPTPSSIGYTVLTGTEASNIDFEDPRTGQYAFFGITSVDISDVDGFETGSLSSLVIFYDANFGEIEFEEVLPFNTDWLIYCRGEWMAFSSCEVTDVGEVTIYGLKRGMIGTRPRDIPSGSIIYFHRISSSGLGEASFRLLNDEPILFKIQNENIYGRRDLARDPNFSFTPNRDMERPVRPRNLRLDDERPETDFVVVDLVERDLTFSASNKFIIREETSVEVDTPEEPEEYEIRIYLDGSLQSTFVQSSLTRTIDFSLYTDSVNGEIRVYSRRIDNSRLSPDFGFIKFFNLPTYVLLSGDEEGFLLMSGDESGRIKRSGARVGV